MEDENENEAEEGAKDESSSESEHVGEVQSADPVVPPGPGETVGPPSGN